MRGAVADSEAAIARLDAHAAEMRAELPKREAGP
jgi:hypothetical protein